MSAAISSFVWGLNKKFQECLFHKKVNCFFKVLNLKSRLPHGPLYISLKSFEFSRSQHGLMSHTEVLKSYLPWIRICSPNARTHWTFCGVVLDPAQNSFRQSGRISTRKLPSAIPPLGSLNQMKNWHKWFSRQKLITSMGGDLRFFPRLTKVPAAWFYKRNHKNEKMQV